MLSALFLPILLLAGPDIAPDPTPPVLSRVRPTSDIARRMVIDAAARSPTVTALIEEIERSDVFVYVELQFDIPGAPAQTTLLGANEAGRFLRVAVEASREPRRRLELLAHELQHAVEISREKHVRSTEAMRLLFTSIGWAMGERSFETAGAIDIERQARREMGMRSTSTPPLRAPGPQPAARIPG